MATSARTKADDAPGETLKDRYALQRVLGQGTQGTTYLADDLETGERVAVKELDLSQADDWKAIELFERESETLQSLDHPAIPAYVDGFHLGTPDENAPNGQTGDAGATEDGGTRFFLVQEYIDGEVLQDEIDGGLRFDERQAREFLADFLPILVYLHELNPPVVHRDVKPSNIIRRDDGWALVDFGAVQTIVRETVGGSTVVGTSGYVPPEQLMGRAEPASDLYALGATVVELLTGTDPAELPVEQMAIQFRDAVDVTDDFADYLERFLAAAPENRFDDAGAALDALRTGELPDDESTVRDDEAARFWRQMEEADELKPDDVRSRVSASPERLEVVVPPPVWGLEGTLHVVIGAMILLGGLSVASCSAFFADKVNPELTVFLFVFGVYLVYAGYQFAKQSVSTASQRLVVDRDGVRFERGHSHLIGRGLSVDESASMNFDGLYLPHASLRAHDSDHDDVLVRKDYGCQSGLIFEDRDGGEQVFGTRLVPVNDEDTDFTEEADAGARRYPVVARELKWLERKVGAYMNYTQARLDE